MNTQREHTTALGARNLHVGYGEREIITDLDIAPPTGELSILVGPNACGKSTLLRALARVLRSRGEVFLRGRDIRQLKPEEIARDMALLPQSPTAPSGIIGRDLVGRGRYPHQDILGRWRASDEQAVAEAMERAHISDLADKRLDELSGGQRQRVWLALVLAQQIPIVLLDEPTTYLDITHQVEVLNLARDLQESGVTVVMVLHELTLAFRYTTNLVVMRDGAVVAAGAVTDVVTESLLSDVYQLDCQLIDNPETGRPIVVPRMGVGKH